jgi:hypothetical protein
MEKGSPEEERQSSQEKGKATKEGTPPWGVARKNNKGIAVCSMMKAAKPNHPTTEKDAMRNYITQHVPGTHPKSLPVKGIF